MKIGSLDTLSALLSLISVTLAIAAVALAHFARKLNAESRHSQEQLRKLLWTIEQSDEPQEDTAEAKQAHRQTSDRFRDL